MPTCVYGFTLTVYTYVDSFRFILDSRHSTISRVWEDEGDNSLEQLIFLYGWMCDRNTKSSVVSIFAANVDFGGGGYNNPPEKNVYIFNSLHFLFLWQSS